MHADCNQIPVLAAEKSGGVLLLRMQNPPVNALSHALRQALYRAFTEAKNDPQTVAIVLCGGGRLFCAGGDLREFGTPAVFAEPRLSADIFPAIESCGLPVVAALHGGAIGGGFEMALSCHYRIAAADTRLAFPEVRHGIIPLSGTVRLPRLMGIEGALQMILETQELRADDERCVAVFDRIVETAADLIPQALRLAHDLAGRLPSGRLARERAFPETEPRAALSAALLRYPREQLSPAQSGALAAVRAGVELADFDAALAEAQRIHDSLARTKTALADGERVFTGSQPRPERPP